MSPIGVLLSSTISRVKPGPSFSALEMAKAVRTGPTRALQLQALTWSTCVRYGLLVNYLFVANGVRFLVVGGYALAALPER